LLIGTVAFSHLCLGIMGITSLKHWFVAMQIRHATSTRLSALLYGNTGNACPVAEGGGLPRTSIDLPPE
jgi:hypothetical protein